MKRRPRDIGTAAETAVVRAARPRGYPWADRLAGHGNADVGDVMLCPGVVVEVKGGDAAKTASDLQIINWLDETECERGNAGAAVAFLVVQRPHVGAINAHRWWAWWRLGWVSDLGPSVGIDGAAMLPVRMTLADALTMLRAAGYGDPL